MTELASVLGSAHNYTYLLRLYATELLPETLSQVLYIDVDTVVASSLGELAAMQLGDDCSLAAVKDLVRASDYPRLGLDESSHIYFNSGVMLINLAYWRKNDIGHACREWLRKNGKIANMADQDALNVVNSGHVAYLHPRYNCIVSFFARREYLRARVRKEELDKVQEAVKNPAVIHYVMNKPWHKGGYLPMRGLWLQALGKTEWRDTPIDYKHGWKGRIRCLLKAALSYALPLVGRNMKSEIFFHRRYRIVQWGALAFYYGFAYWLPNFSTRYIGKYCNTIRRICVRRIFDYCGEGVNIGRKAYFGKGTQVWIGNNSNLGDNCKMPSDIIIGENVMMGPYNYFFNSFTHNTSDRERPMIKQGFRRIEGRMEICDDVWIGRECMFMPCRKIGAHSVIGARSVVTKDVPEYVVAAGNPARIKKNR